MEALWELAKFLGVIIFLIWIVILLGFTYLVVRVIIKESINHHREKKGSRNLKGGLK
jgi:hypothetical protein